MGSLAHGNLLGDGLIPIRRESNTALLRQDR